MLSLVLLVRLQDMLVMTESKNRYSEVRQGSMLQVSALCCIMLWGEEKCMKKTLIKNIGQLVTPKGRTALRGAAMGRLEIRQDAAIYMDEGRIREIGPSRELLSLADGATEVIDGEGKCAVPGLWIPYPFPFRRQPGR